MLRLKPILTTLILLAILFMPMGAARSAEEEQPVAENAALLASATELEVVSCNPALEITLLFAFLDKTSKAESEALLARWQAGIDAVWQHADTRYGYGDSTCAIAPTIRLLELEAGETCGYLRYHEHCVDVVHAALNQRGQVADMSAAAINRNVAAYGEWTTGTTATEAAHLFGHLLGLADSFVQKEVNNSGQLSRVALETKEVAADEVAPLPSPMMLDFADHDFLSPTEEELTQIAAAAGLQCDRSCYCGNGVLNTELGERCDPAFGLNSCAIGESCSDQCTCETRTPSCGDGVVSPSEQCDPAAKNICPASYTCTADCTCDAPLAPQRDVQRPQFVCGDGICEPSESCTTCYLDCRDKLNCQACGNGICESNESPLSCSKDCGGID